MITNIADIRKDYMLRTLDESEVDNNPFNQFTKWWGEAIDSKIEEVNAMTVSTVTQENKPAARICLLKGYDENGFVFYTNYMSAKGSEIANNSNVCLLLFWKELERQVRIDGIATKVDTAESDEYFCSRPVGSRIGAWCSPQSQVIEGRHILEENVRKYTEKFKDTEDVPRPPHWGGYRIKPVTIEFWQGRSSRLHDRILYTAEGNKWRIQRVAP